MVLKCDLGSVIYTEKHILNYTRGIFKKLKKNAHGIHLGKW